MAGNGKAAAAILLGAAIGAGLGILFAPDKGTETRKKIKDGYDGKKEDLKNKVDQLTSSVKSKFKGSKADLESAFDDLAANVDDKTHEVIATLEKKLADLKKSADAFKAKTT